MEYKALWTGEHSGVPAYSELLVKSPWDLSTELLECYYMTRVTYLSFLGVYLRLEGLGQIGRQHTIAAA